MATNNEHYTVLSYNMGSYEIIHPVKVKSDRARYIMVTDDPNLKDESGSWEIVYDETLKGSAFDKVMQVRWDPWKYTDDKIVLRIDGSVGIESSLDPLIDRFCKDKSDLSIMVHPTRNTMYDEYEAWVKMRGYSIDQANAVLGFLQMAEGFPVKDYKGLAQLCYIIQRRNRLNEDLNRMVYAFLKYIGDQRDAVERVDQCIFSFILQKYFGKANVMFIDQRMYNGEASKAPFQWYAHNSDQPFPPIDVKTMKEPYFFNKRLHNVVRPQDL